MTSKATTWTIETRRDAAEFLSGQWATKPTASGEPIYTAAKLASWTSAQVIDHARDVMRRIHEAEQQQEPKQ